MEKQRRRRFRFTAVMMFLAFVLLVKNINGQEEPSEQSYQFFRAEIERIANAKFRIGPLRIFPAFSLRIGYDNNVYRDLEFPNPDYTAQFSIPIDVYLPLTKWLIFSVTESPEYVYYLETKHFRGWNNTISAQIRMLLLNRFVISGSYLNSRIRRRVTVEFDAPNYENIKGFTGSIFYEPRGRISLGFSGTTREMEYDEPNVSQRLNRRVKSGTLTLYYRFSLGSRFFLRGGYSQFSFQTFTLVSRETDSYSINSGITFPLLGRIRGILSIGYRKVMPRAELWPDFSGIVGNTALTWSINRFRFRINYGRNTSFSLGNSLYFVNESIGAGVSFFLTQSIRLGYDFNYNRAKYPMPASDNLSDRLNNEIYRLDIYRTHSARIIFRIVRNTGIGIDVSYWERDSALIGFSRKNTFVFIYLTTAFNL